MQQFIQSVNNAPFVKKLRTLEQRRMARVSTQHKNLRESASKAVTTLDLKAKESLKQTLKDQAEDITYIIDALDETEDYQQ
ncbi:MAG: hypothetical protein ACO37D_12205 [Rhodothermales bacterium]